MKPRPDDLDPAVLARASHPATSHQAAAEIIDAVYALQKEVADAVRDNPGLTANELAEKCGLRDNRKYGRRLPELARLGVIRRGEARKCGVTGRSATTWWPRPRPQEQGRLW